MGFSRQEYWAGLPFPPPGDFPDPGIEPMSLMLSISLPFHLVYIAEFGVVFLFSGSLWSSLYCGCSSLWVGLDEWLVKVSWLRKLALVFWWVELGLFSLECNEVSGSEF